MIQFDADGQHRPEYLAALVEKAENTGSDIVIGSRFRLSAKINRCAWLVRV
ncbi:MAG: glycosyltransferase [Collinsella sp.]